MSESPPTGTEARVCKLIASRQQLGISKYGCTVADNPLALLDWMRHFRAELADALVYIQRAIEDMENAANPFNLPTCYYCSSTDHPDSPCPKRKADADRFDEWGREVYPTPESA